MPMITGKLRTAMTILLLFVLEASAERMDKDAEKPNALSTNVIKNSGTSCIGLVNNKEKKKNPALQIPVHKRKP